MITVEQRTEFRKHFRYNVGRRLVLDKAIKCVVFLCVVVAVVPLIAILVNVFSNGATVRFFNDVLAEFPTIVIGVFTFVLIVLTVGDFSVWAGSFALSIVMLPIVMQTTEESLKLVPVTYREAGYALGIRRWKVVFTIVLSGAKSGLVTGILLSVARIAGETAPLVFTILGSSQFIQGFDGPIDALPLRIWRLSSLPYDSSVTQGWGAAFVLIILVLSINICVRYLFLQRKGQTMLKFKRLGSMS